MRGPLLMLRRGSLLPCTAGVAGELCAAESPALEEVTDRIGLQLGLLGHCVLEEVLSVAGGAIAVVIRLVVVPPTALVPGGAVEDLEAQVGVLEADADQLGQIIGAHPDR